MEKVKIISLIPIRKLSHVERLHRFAIHSTIVTIDFILDTAIKNNR